MPRGDKSAYNKKQRRQARHIEKSEKARGRSTRVSERIAWATVNKQDGGAKPGPGSRSRRASGKKKASRTTARRRTASRSMARSK